MPLCSTAGVSIEWGVHVNGGEAVSNSSAAIQANIGEAHHLQQPAQDVQHRGPLAEDQGAATLCLQQQLFSLSQQPGHAHARDA